MNSNVEPIELDTLRGLVVLQPRGRAHIARATGIALPNLSAFLRTGLDSLLSSERRARLLREIGLTASGWLKAGCHVWRTEDVENVVRVCQWVVPKGHHVLLRELRGENDLLDGGAALVHVYLLKWMVDERPRRVLLQLRVTEQQAIDARNRLINCGLFATDKNGEIPVLPITAEELAKLSEIKDMAGREFDDLYDRGSEVSWDAVIKMLPDLFRSAGEAYAMLQAHAASRVIGRAKRRVRGGKSE